MKDYDKGIWIDERQAWILSCAKNNLLLKTIRSEVEAYHLHGGSGSSTPYGPQDVVSETALNRRKDQQLRNYFQLVISEILPAKRLFITGPAGAKTGLHKELNLMKDHTFESITTESSDSMTENQFKALVREFFGQNKGLS